MALPVTPRLALMGVGDRLTMTFCQRVECRVYGLAIALVVLMRWLHAALTQVLTEASFPSHHLRQPV